MGKRRDQFWLLVWKNYKIFRKNPGWIICELLVPWIATVVFATQMHWGDERYFNHTDLEISSTGDVFGKAMQGLERLQGQIPCPHVNILVSFGKNVQGHEEIFAFFKRRRGAFLRTRKDHNHTGTWIFGFQKMSSVEKMNKLLVNDNRTQLTDCPPHRGGIYIDKFDVANSIFDFTVFMPKPDNNEVYRLKDDFPNNQPYSWSVNHGTTPLYSGRGYTALQCLAIDVFFEARAKDKKNYSPFVAFMHRLPEPDHYRLQAVFQADLWAVLMLLPVVLRSVIVISDEQELGHRELLKIMGMDSVLYFASHSFFIFIKIFAALFPFMLVLIIKLFWHVNPINIFILILLYNIDLILFIHMCAVIFTSAKAAMNGTITVFFATAINFITVRYDDVKWEVIASVNFQRAFRIGISTAVDFARRRRTLAPWTDTFSNMGTEVTFGVALLMLIADALLMLFLLFLLDRLRQNFHIDYIFFWRRKNIENIGDLNLDVLNENHEKDEGRSQLPADIILDNVVKVYTNGAYGVRKLDLVAHRNQVTALLGHNGAGKSTAFNMICGTSHPTTGTVYVNDEEHVGYCPQNNVLYKEMNVYEHLWLFVNLKGVKENQEEQINQLLKDVKLGERMHTSAEFLSGGEKRKLCLAMALAGSPRVLLLDEPTAGMDVSAREAVKSLLETYKENRTVLITTHYLDEAEEMGDFVYIMFDGVVFTSGTVEFLLKRYGSGTLLRFLAAEGKDVNALSKKAAKIAKDTIGGEITDTVADRQAEIAIPTSDAFNKWHANFVKALKLIEDKKDEIGYETFGIERNSLESVFFRVGDLAEKMTGVHKEEYADDPSVNDRQSVFLRPIFRFLASLLKRFVHTCDNVFLLLFYLFAPVVILWIIVKIDVNQIRREFSLSKLDGMVYPLLDPDKRWDGSEYKQYFKDHGFEMTTFAHQNIINKPLNTYTDYPPLGLGFMYHNMQRVGDTVVGLFNNEAFHALPTGVNVIANVRLRNELKQENRPVDSARITSRIEVYTPITLLKLTTSAILCSFIICGLTLYLTIIVAFPVEEENCKFAHLQGLTSVSKFTLWCANFFYDFLWYLVVCGLFVGLFFIFEVLSPYWLICLASFVMFFFCTAPYMYSFAKFCKRTETAIIMMVIILAFVYSICFMASLLIQTEKRENVVDKEDTTLEWPLLLVMMFSPMYADFVLLSKLSNLQITATGSVNEWQLQVGGWPLIVLAVNIVIYFLFFRFAHSKLPRKLRYALGYGPIVKKELEEAGNPLARNDDVIAEEMAVKNAPGPSSPNTKDTASVEQGSTDGYVLKAIDLAKNFPPVRALRGITFGIKRGECFALLGASGAGKTTAFEIITEIAPATSGSVYLERDPETGLRIGYCPQSDAILDCLTGKQAMVILACLHGYAKPVQKASHVLYLVGMKEMENKPIRNCSGGQRRRISLAAALLARAPLTILDEPTAGVDSKCRRELWNYLNMTRAKENTTMMLTSHSMDECEALCSKIAILNRGEIAAIGSAQYLKSKYGGSYKMLMVLKSLEKRAEAEEKVDSEFPSSILLTKNHMSLHIFWKIEKTDVDKWSAIWERGSAIASQVEARTFCVTQATLEEAFIQVISEIRPEEVNAIDPNESLRKIAAARVKFTKTLRKRSATRPKERSLASKSSGRLDKTPSDEPDKTPSVDKTPTPSADKTPSRTTTSGDQLEKTQHSEKSSKN